MKEAYVITTNTGRQGKDPPGKIRGTSQAAPPKQHQCLSARILLEKQDGAKSWGKKLSVKTAPGVAE